MPFVSVNGIELCYESFGKASNPCVLLIAGIGQQLIDWDVALCDEIVDAGLRVVRFDNRDAGLSSHMSDAYALDDMADDAIALLTALDIAQAHVLGVSMGGMIAQLVALRAPSQVASLVLLSTNPGGLEVGQPTTEIQALWANPPTEGALLDRAVERSSHWASWGLGVTPAVLRARIKQRIERNYDSGAQDRQLAAILNAPERTARLSEIKVPTVVIHGTDDPMVDISGGEAIAKAIPNADFIAIKNLRHDIPSVIWPDLIRALRRNLSEA